MASLDPVAELNESDGTASLSRSNEDHESNLKASNSMESDDPRNWSSARKTLLFIALMSSSLLADGAMVWGSTLVTQQAMDWNITINHSATSMNYGILLQGFGGIFAVPLIEAYGRFPIWIWPQVITMFMVLGATLSHDYGTFTTFRSLQGLFGTVPQVIGLPIIHDVYQPDGFAVLVTFLWPIGITTTIDTFMHSPPYLFNTIEASSMRFAGVIGALCGWVVGYVFNERIYHRHSNDWRPEYRLHGVWFPAGSLIAGLLTYGLTMKFGKHWIGIAFGWIMVNIGMVAIIVTITSYALAKYPEKSTCVSAILNMWRTCGGFAVGYFQPAWIIRNGLGLVFGIQAIVVCVAIILTITPVIIWGHRKSQVDHERVESSEAGVEAV
ncbi:hypothetical protein N7478_012119 [Penicillium angulare]|uniref:uncharacterized protein n=1 Tax=Penicillium angulare TaxID=116970 RepID=UPI002541726C|nr:uncharacterized protein N7478_012119 [Penicillium angulare]KAJ5260514.1 hypothetical protein N7478_012119 [Penicillium angulare]